MCLAMPAYAFPVERCINLGNGLDAPREGDWGYWIDRNHFRKIAAEGFDTVRIPVRFSAHYRDGRISRRFLARVDEVVGWALQYDLRVILDLHHFNEIMKDPDGQADRFIGIWKHLARHYEGASDKLIFELLNEPHGNLTNKKAADLYARAMGHIRARHPDRWVILGGDDYSSVDGLSGLPVFDDRTVHTFHFYDPFRFTHQQAPFVDQDLPLRRWNRPTEKRDAATRLKRGLSHRKAPVFLGEFGVYDAAPAEDAEEWLRFVRTAAEDAGVGWCVWSFSSSFRTYETRTRDWNRGRLRALIPAK